MYIDHGHCVSLDGLYIYKSEQSAEYRVFLAWLAEGNTPELPPQPTFAQRVASLLSRVDALLNEAARQRGYDDIRSAALRAGYAGPFHAEGVAFAQWMDATYAACYQLLAQVQAGESPEPTETELLALLPVLELP